MNRGYPTPRCLLTVQCVGMANMFSVRAGEPGLRRSSVIRRFRLFDETVRLERIEKLGQALCAADNFDQEWSRDLQLASDFSDNWIADVAMSASSRNLCPDDNPAIVNELIISVIVPAATAEHHI